jgi:hypothetical protein
MIPSAICGGGTDVFVGFAVGNGVDVSVGAEIGIKVSMAFGAHETRTMQTNKIITNFLVFTFAFV